MKLLCILCIFLFQYVRILNFFLHFIFFYKKKCSLSQISQINGQYRSMIQQRLATVDDNMETDGHNISELKKDLENLEAAYSEMAKQKALMENDLNTYK